MKRILAILAAVSLCLGIAVADTRPPSSTTSSVPTWSGSGTQPLVVFARGLKCRSVSVAPGVSIPACSAPSSIPCLCTSNFGVITVFGIPIGFWAFCFDRGACP